MTLLHWLIVCLLSVYLGVVVQFLIELMHPKSLASNLGFIIVQSLTSHTRFYVFFDAGFHDCVSAAGGDESQRRHPAILSWLHHACQRMICCDRR